MRESESFSLKRSVKISHNQVVDFSPNPFKFDLEVKFEKYIPVKVNSILRIFKNKTEKVAEFQIELTKFISENLMESELEINTASGKPGPLIVRAFKFKCCLQNLKKPGESPNSATRVVKKNRKFSNEDDDGELPTMNMLKFTSSNEEEKNVDSGRVPKKLDENLIMHIISQS